jgi:hypothetical protein
MSDDEREEKELDLTSPEVVTKYKSAAEIVNSTSSLSLYIYVSVCVLWFCCTLIPEWKICRGFAACDIRVQTKG